MRIGTNAFTPPPVGSPPQPDNNPPPPSTSTALALSIDSLAIVAAEFFKPSGSDAILATLEAEVRKQAAELDISTDAGRKAIASLAYKVAKTKTGLDSARKDLVADKKAEVKAIDEEGARILERIEALQAEVRQPLTDWENGNKVRVAGHEGTIVTLQAYVAWASDNWQTAPIADIEANLKEVREFERDWQEFVKRGKQARDLAEIALAEALDRRRTRDAEQEELKRLRAEKAQREERERIEAAAEEARAAERRKAEAQMEEQRQAAEAERIRVENERNEAAARAQQAEAERIQAEERAASELQESERRAQAERERAERQARETAERVERERVEAAERAQRDQDAAVAAERGRLEAEQRDRDRLAEEDAERIRVETAKRERNKAHRRSIEAAAVQGLILCCGDEVTALAVVEAISAGKIPNVKIEY
jgi:hypothetical protein